MNTPEDHDYVSAFDELPLWSAPFGLLLLSKIKMGSAYRVLDIGSGTGFPLLELAMRMGRKARFFGLDTWQAALDRTFIKCRQYRLDNVELICCPAEEMPFQDDYFHVIVSNNGLNNVSDPECVLKECSRCLLPEGQLLFAVNLQGTMKEFYAIFEQLMDEYHLIEEKVHMYEHIRKLRPSVDHYIALLNNAGFENISYDEQSLFYRFADGTALLNHQFIRNAFLPSWQNMIPEKLSIKNKKNITTWVRTPILKYL